MSKRTHKKKSVMITVNVFESQYFVKQVTGKLLQMLYKL